MENLRRRVPFTFSESAGEDTRVLDEQEQEAVVESLRQESLKSNQQYLLLTYALLGMSTLLQIISLFGSPESNPILNVYPTSQIDGRLSIPISRVFTLIFLVIHFDLFRSIYPDERGTTNLIGISIPITPSFIYFATAWVPLLLSLLLACPWQTTVWWSIPMIMTFVTNSVKESIEDNNKLLSELESKKYVARGA